MNEERIRAPATLRRREQDDGSGRPERYTGQNVAPAYSLRYDWTGWPTAGTALPANIVAVARDTSAAWEADGLRMLEPLADGGHIQILFSATPQVSPVFFCQRVKGRLQHALRQAGTAVDFSRKVSFRSLGENTTGVVEEYIRKQVGRADWADPRFRETMRGFTVARDEVRLDQPSDSGSGRYWYNLHVVLVVADRFRITRPDVLGEIRDCAFAVAEEHGDQIAALSVMPDHVHLAVRGAIDRSPAAIALSFQNGLARAAGCRVWQDSYYVGTFSEYDLSVIRAITRQS